MGNCVVRGMIGKNPKLSRLAARSNKNPNSGRTGILAQIVKNQEIAKNDYNLSPSR